MKNKKILLVILLFIFFSILGGVIYFINKPDKNTTLTLLDKQWIESNKNKVIDFSITNDVPIYSYNGEGIVFEFLEDVKNDTNIEFNKTSLTEDENVKNGFLIVDNLKNNDLLLNEDNYAVVSKENINYKKATDIKNLIIGTLDTKLEKVNNSLEDSYNLAFKAYKSYDELFNAVEVGDVHAIIVPKLYTMNNIISGKLNINYTIDDISDKYIIRLGDNERLNAIIEKYFKKWYAEKSDELFGENFVNNYFAFSETTEKNRVSFRSKRYIYGFVNNAPYDTILRGKLSGINNAAIKKFATMADVEIIYKEYDNFTKLINDFNSNNVDFFYDVTGTEKFKMDVYQTTNFGYDKIMILSNINNDNFVSSIGELNSHDVLVINGTSISKFLNMNKVNFKGYDNINSLINATKENSVLVVDQGTYDYYVRDALKEFKVDTEISFDNNYKFTVRSISSNKVFSEFFNFYLSFVDHDLLINEGYQEIVVRENNFALVKNVVLYFLALWGIIAFFVAMIKGLFKPRDRKSSLSKEDKIRYIDMLTSLKNRNYLNDNIEKWDASEVYPQGLVVVDLNNVAYINDNYGHSEGDNVIKEAANILIKTQIENSEIIRTDGNEFLIYTVGYDEKQIISYIKKLNRELKTLAHGFGAAIGYSIITDAIKTVDDAVNEATIDMRNNKQEWNNNN